MVRTLDWKYTYDPDDPVDELYDLRTDPEEQVNLAAEESHAPKVAELRSRLLEWSVRTEGGTRPTPLPDQANYEMTKRNPNNGRR